MGASSGNTRGGPVFCFVSSFLQLHPICQSVTTNRKQASKQAISAHTILYVQYTQERTHARTYAPIVLTLYPTVPHSTTRFFPPSSRSVLCSFLPPFLSFFFFIPVVLSFNPLHLYNDCFSEFLGLFLLSPICSSLLSFLILSSLRPPTLFHSSLSFFSLATFAQMRDDSQQSGNLGNYAAVSE